MNKENETIVDSEESIKRVYEVSYILVPTISENSATAKAEAFKKSIADLGASFISEEAPYMRDLAYEMVRVIKNANNRFDTGYFGWIKFEMDPSLLATFEKNIKLDEDVIRYLAIKADRDLDVFTRKALTAKVREGEEANIDTSVAPAEEVVADQLKEEVK